MAQALDQARHQRELTKESLSRNIDLLETRVRAELDWKARLRRDGARYAIYGGVAFAGAAGLLILRRAVSHGDKDDLRASSKGDLLAEMALLREAIDDIDKKRRKQDAPVWQKLAVKAITTAAATAATSAVRQMMERSQEPEQHGSH